MSKKRKYVVHVWFLDTNLATSACMLTDKCLANTITGCVGALVASCLYLAGIRSKKIYSFMFSKEHATQTTNEKFFGWPLSRCPSFNSFSWKESKWCRMCHNNYDITLNYLSVLLDEYIWRHSKAHPASPMLEWASSNELIANFPYVELKDISLPWKSIDPKFRTIDIIGGYRKQYCATQIDDGDPFAAYSRCKRDIPDFVSDAFNLSTVFEH